MSDEDDFDLFGYSQEQNDVATRTKAVELAIIMGGGNILQTAENITKFIKTGEVTNDNANS